MTLQTSKAGKRSRSMMTTSSSSVVVLATVLSIASMGNGGGMASAFMAPAATPTLVSPLAKTMAGRSMAEQSQLSAKKNSNEYGVKNPFSQLFSCDSPHKKSQVEKNVATLFTTIGFSALFLTNPVMVHAEDELNAMYGGKGLDTSLVDKDCLIDKCSLQAKACLQDDPDCRKGLTCTAKCLGDNSCITGCFARYGTPQLDGLLKCTIEDHDCIKVAILEGGADKPGEEPKSIAPTVQGFNMASMEGTWYKVAGYNPNYDCYACQRNTFSAPQGGLVDEANERLASMPNGNVRIPTGGLLGTTMGQVGADRLQMDVEFSMPRMLEDGSPPPPSGVRESLGGDSGLQSVGYNQYSTHETMVFDSAANNGGVGEKAVGMMLGKKGDEKLFSRTAHSEGEMFGLKFWENWYIIGENNPGQDEFKFVYYNGKTRQNTYDGAFVYSRNRNLSPASMEKVYQIASDAAMNPDKFCKINNGCFDGVENAKKESSAVEREGLGSPNNPFRGILASTKVSEILGVESVAAENMIPTSTIANDYLTPTGASSAPAVNTRPWWKEIGDYLEDPHRHFQLMDSLRKDMDWPEYIKARN
mmetsp:Transcript_16434/g.25766  ORF Transcript_16434/g.25766 Transcript_16434/m.25766 type:complete len:586 (+) Transcript_16434:163-1920(+)|eukprot:CAMPEP_0201599426 /NCGR_PEP_ID=MMETSP0492-20130828/876_1 /ASSEMBLY_ACC=CAM_ASM_000837 /TAXON_ID=420259 /ORGANISM="Thalassiosira gravida, Strain GMp14c1" /LENGTH=585 /DNA_ID=CAMNT_0048061995 /DNA_START=137 /DNA_END=1894 /DNA_ORIENTATION=-